MQKSLIEIANPVRIHLGYISSIMERRQGNIDQAFLETLNEFDYNAAEIFYHGLNGLYRAIQVYKNPNTNFSDHDLERLHLESIKIELLKLYTNVINKFSDLLEGIDYTEGALEINSPLGGNKIKIRDWFDTCVMHTIHHVGQAIRIQGMVMKKHSNLKFERIETSSYQIFE